MKPELKPKVEVLLKTEWFNVEAEQMDDVPALNGKPIYRINTADSVVAVVLTPKNEIVCLKQYRPVIKRTLLELPAGIIDPGETPEFSAKRELREETGFSCEKLILAQTGGATVDRINTTIYVFGGLAAKRDAAFVPEIGIEVVLMPVKEFVKYQLSRDYMSIPTFGALLAVKWKFNQLGYDLDIFP